MNQIITIKETIRNINWSQISSNWMLNQGSKIIKINPKKACSRKSNPLYKHASWLEYLYNTLDLSYRTIANISNVDKGTISYWMKKFQIPLKEKNGEWIGKDGYINVYTSKDYWHPELIPTKRGKGRFVRKKHQVVIENFFSKNKESEISNKFLIKGKYLRSKCVVHHINFSKIDNRIENLWVFENQKEHMKSVDSIRNCISTLIKLGKIIFKNNSYSINKSYDIKKLDKDNIRQVLKSLNENYYKKISHVKNSIKKIDLNSITSNWKVKYRQNQFKEYKIINLDPYSDCSKENPLYRHRAWLIRIVTDKKYNLSDSRLANLCGISKEKARGWRRRLGVSRGRNWGFKRFINSKGRVFIKPSSYYSPVALNNNGWILEHRYLLEEHLKKNIVSEFARKCLDNNGFLKSSVIVHHINLDPTDNRIENLIILFSESEHKTLEYTLFNFVKDLINTRFITFSKGIYKIMI